MKLMNRSCLVDSRRSIEIDKLSTQGTCINLKDSQTFKESKKKYYEEICPQQIFEQMKINSKKKMSKANQISDSVFNDRKSLYVRLKKIYKDLRLSNQTLHLALYYLDTIISSCGKFVNILSENVALGCLSLASKIILFILVKFFEFDENENQPLLEELENIFCTGVIKYEKNEIKNFEIHCLNKLEYRLNMVTPLMAVEFMISNGIFFDNEPKFQLKTKDEKNYTDPILKFAYNIIEFTIEDFSYYEFTSVHIACSCIALIREITKLENIWCDTLETKYKINLKDFLSCFNFMKSKYYKIKHSKKGRDSSLVRNIPIQAEAVASNRSIFKLDMSILKNLPALTHTTSTDNLKRNIKNRPNYIRIIKLSDKIPKNGNENKYIKEITSPVPSKVKPKHIPTAVEFLNLKKKIICEKKLTCNKVSDEVNRDRKFIEHRYNESENINKAFSHDKFNYLSSKLLENIYKNFQLNKLKSSKSKKKLNLTFLSNDVIPELTYTSRNVNNLKQTKKTKPSMPINSSSNIKSFPYSFKVSKNEVMSKKNSPDCNGTAKKIKENLKLQAKEKVKPISNSPTNIPNPNKLFEKKKNIPLSSGNEFLKKKEELLSK